jgi:hypothetical protein
MAFEAVYTTPSDIVLETNRESEIALELDASPAR